jgi:hypothetical protein
VLKLLADVFGNLQNVTAKEFVAKLEQVRIECTVRRPAAGTYVEVDRFC